MATLHCEHCGLTKSVPDRHIGKQIPCPSCSSTITVSPDGEDSAVFECPNCGYTRAVPAKHAGKTVKCPKCSSKVQIHGPAEPEPPSLNLKEALDEIDRDPDFDPTKREEGEAQPATWSRQLSVEQQEKPRREVGLFHGNPAFNLLGGLVTGATMVAFAFSFAVLLFGTGVLQPDFSHGLSLMLFSFAALSVVSVIRSRVGMAVYAPETVTITIMWLLCSDLLSRMQGVYPDEYIFPTLVVSLAGCALVAGFTLAVAGAMGAGRWSRFIPHQVAGGLLAGAGVWLVLGAARVATHTGECITDLAPGVFTALNVDAAALGLQCGAWLPPLLFGLLLLVIFRIGGRRQLLIPVVLVLVVGLTHVLMMQTTGQTTAPSGTASIFLTGHTFVPFWEFFVPQTLDRIVWGELYLLIPYALALVALIMATVMMRISLLEADIRRDILLDDEFAAVGLGNLLAGVAGGVGGSFSSTLTRLGYGLGARGPIAVIVAGLVCLAAIPFVGMAAGFVPTFVPLGLVMFLGLRLVVRWLVDVRADFSLSDYLVLFLLFLFSLTIGFLPAVAIGLGISLMTLISRYNRVDLVKQALSGQHHRSNVDRSAEQFDLLKREGGSIFILRLQGFLFQGSISVLIRRIRQRIHAPGTKPLRYLVLDFTWLNGLDSSAAVSFTKLKNLALDEKFTLIFTNLPFEVVQQLEESGLELDDPAETTKSFVDLDYAMEWCEDHILEVAGAFVVHDQTLSRLLEPIFPEPDVLPALMRQLERVEANKGQYVFRQGDPSDAMYFIESGMVNIQLEVGGNKIIRLKKLAPGTVFGEMGIYTDAPRSASVVAAGDCVLYRLSKKTLEDLQNTDAHLVSAVHRFVVNLLSGRVFEANQKVRDLTR